MGDAVTVFVCLACPEPAVEGGYYCAACLALGRTMRASAAGTRSVVQVVCPGCAGSSPAFTDVDRAACLHCFMVLDLTAVAAPAQRRPGGGAGGGSTERASRTVTTLLPGA